MTLPETPVLALEHVASPQTIGSQTLMGVCASLKPAAGRRERSAVRSLLSYSLAHVKTVYPDVSLLDLREQRLPFFDGRMPQEINDASLRFVWSCIDRSGGLLLSVPAYWSGVSGVFKNFIDVLCGPVYAMRDEINTVFNNKPTGLLVVGADESSAQLGLQQAVQIMSCVGSRLVGDPVVISNPQLLNNDMERLSCELITLGAELARSVKLGSNDKP